jgi:hypothetical protein
MGYACCGDSALWTVAHMDAEVFQYKVTRSADAINNLKTARAGLKAFGDVTGDNRLARCLVRADSPYAAIEWRSAQFRSMLAAPSTTNAADVRAVSQFLFCVRPDSTNRRPQVVACIQEQVAHFRARGSSSSEPTLPHA